MTRPMLCSCIGLAVGMVLSGCSKSTPTPPPPDTNKTVVFSDTFENDSAFTANWTRYYLAQETPPRYAWLTITTSAFHGGAKSITSDSSHCGIVKGFEKRDTGIVGMEYYLMASALSQAVFSGTISESGGSSSMPLHSYGFAFDSTDSIRTIDFDYIDTMRTGKNIARIQAGHWYKVGVEIDFRTTKTITYHLDGVLVSTVPIPSSAASAMLGVDVVEVLRATTPAGGPKPYYIDDISVSLK